MSLPAAEKTKSEAPGKKPTGRGGGSFARNGFQRKGTSPDGEADPFSWGGGEAGPHGARRRKPISRPPSFTRRPPGSPPAPPGLPPGAPRLPVFRRGARLVLSTGPGPRRRRPPPADSAREGAASIKEPVLESLYPTTREAGHGDHVRFFKG
ncbi:MAG: hypothetical protein GY859_03805 [Desulfobacterales bacterium]|nr:hypothetical protein [Desulfobacterales bacterium]